MCLVVGALIGCGSVRAVPGRPFSLHLTFGAVMGYAFWLCIGVVRNGDFIALIPALLLVVGAAWLLREPGWPSAIFTWIAVAICLGLLAEGYRNRYTNPYADPAEVAQAVATAVVLLVVGVAESVVGLTGTILGKSRKKKRTAPRAIRTPSEPPIL
jgi:hypothetical protein